MLFFTILEGDKPFYFHCVLIH